MKRMCVGCFEDYVGLTGPYCPSCVYDHPPAPAKPQVNIPVLTDARAMELAIPVDGGFMPNRSMLDVLADIA